VAEDIKQNIAQVRRRITLAAKRALRDPGEITLVAVGKTHGPKVIKKALDAKITALGENKVQEAEEKIDKVGRDAAVWHLVGQLQKNKVRKAVQLFDVIHSVDSPELAHRLDRIAAEEGRTPLSVFLQVDLAGEKTKSGVPVPQLQLLIEVLKRCENLRLDGLMILPPFDEDPESTRPYFQRLREIRDRLSLEGAFAGGRGHLSMGMSNDFEVAVEEGATVVRIGTAIFGERK
jgi:PLP dependent protein